MNEVSESAAVMVEKFADKLGDLLNEKRFSDLLLFLKDDHNQKKIYDDSLDIVSTICISLKENEDILNDSLNFDLCKEILCTIVDKGNPKEVLLALLEAADSFKKEEFFQLLLPPIQRALMLVPGKRGRSLQWVLNILDAHISSLLIPENRDFEAPRSHIEYELTVFETGESLKSYVKFLEPFIKEVSFNNTEKQVYSDRIVFQREVLQKYLLRPLNRPLVYHDLHLQAGIIKGDVQHCCFILLKYISQTTRNFFKLLDLPPKVSNPDCSDPAEEYEACDAVNILAQANLAYLLFVEHLCPELYPSVYNYSFLFEKYLHLIVALLERKENLVTFKGLHLCKAMLDCVSEYSLPGSHLSEDKYIALSDVLMKVAIRCTLQSQRSFAFLLFKTLISRFTWNARYNYLIHVMNSVTDSHVQGLLIDLYKNLLHNSLNEPNNNYFSGRNLHSFLRIAFQLDEGAETDILEHYDKIVGGLDFLRFVIILDKKKANITGILDIVDTLTYTYLEPIHKSIHFARRNLYGELCKKKVKELSSKSDISTTITVAGEMFPNVLPNYSDDIEKSLVSLDIMRSLLCEINELLRE